MHTRPVIRAVAALLGALVLLGTVLALAVALDATGGRFDVGGISRLGWLMPAAVAVLVGVLGWVMLTHGKIEDESPRVMVQCVSCGAKVMGGWRMCPYCGRLTEDEESADE